MCLKTGNDEPCQSSVVHLLVSAQVAAGGVVLTTLATPVPALLDRDQISTHRFILGFAELQTKGFVLGSPVTCKECLVRVSLENLYFNMTLKA